MGFPSPSADGYRALSANGQPGANVRRFILLIALALLTVACGGGDDAATGDSVAGTTTVDDTAVGAMTVPEGDMDAPDATNPVVASFILRSRDDGARLRLAVGDEILTRLDPGFAGDQIWVLATPPDPNVLSGGDSITFMPSGFGLADPFVEFTFKAVGKGATTVVISRGPLEATTDQLSFVVEVS
jgi:hypothetical protein